MFFFNQMAQNEFPACKAAERDDAVASLSEADAADRNSSKPLSEMWTCQYTSMTVIKILPTGNGAYRISTPYSTPARYLQHQTDTAHNTICPYALTDIAAGNTVSVYKE